ncbi:phosphate ABC transporter permease subunit PstC [Nocardioides humilatus]|uniref:Phosphate transport system permease protein n=1 Tax=Nocardioides humilatus TaxID=2607660 RepID=A0A5B1LKN4_9ACTN|nr:phosphate ABC transporter permease subunit PstC [Nocardioides humilatus]KAA1421016.1 phosphate ABC transporter permease subunit PstC [Nocardioides humilatus]
MSAETPPTLELVRPVPQRRSLSSRPTTSDRVFVSGSRLAAIATLLIMGLIGYFLTVGAWPALEQQGWQFFTEKQWLPETGQYGIAGLLEGTVLVGVIALIVAVPVSFGAALFISEYAPPALKRPLVTLVDLMAAVPAVIYAIWALIFLQAQLLSVAQWLSVHLGGALPFLTVKTPDSPSSYTSSAFIAGVAVGFVIMPTITSIMREVFSQAPVGEREGAIALGATKWGMIRAVVLPFGRAGIIGGIMLGLGRALGETIVVYALISPIFDWTTHPLESGTNTIAAHIASRYSESNGNAFAGLLAAGMVLFAFTLVINTAAGIVVSRSRSGAATEI